MSMKLGAFKPEIPLSVYWTKRQERTIELLHYQTLYFCDRCGWQRSPSNHSENKYTLGGTNCPVSRSPDPSKRRGQVTQISVSQPGIPTSVSTHVPWDGDCNLGLPETCFWHCLPVLGSVAGSTVGTLGEPESSLM